MTASPDDGGEHRGEPVGGVGRSAVGAVHRVVLSASGSGEQLQQRARCVVGDSLGAGRGREVECDRVGEHLCRAPARDEAAVAHRVGEVVRAVAERRPRGLARRGIDDSIVDAGVDAAAEAVESRGQVPRIVIGPEPAVVRSGIARRVRDRACALVVAAVLGQHAVGEDHEDVALAVADRAAVSARRTVCAAVCGGDRRRSPDRFRVVGAARKGISRADRRVRSPGRPASREIAVRLEQHLGQGLSAGPQPVAAVGRPRAVHRAEAGVVRRGQHELARGRVAALRDHPMAIPPVHAEGADPPCKVVATFAGQRRDLLGDEAAAGGAARRARRCCRA